MKKKHKIALVIVIVLLTAILFNLKKIKRVYKVIHYFDKEVIVENFRNSSKNFPFKRLVSSKYPYRIAKSKKSIKLPTSFTFKDSTIVTEDFLTKNQLEGLMIIQNDTIILEEYRKGLTYNQTHIGWSVTKSILSALLGIAHDDGLFKLDEPITKYLPQFKNTGYDNVLIKDILQMSSGVKFNEDYGDFNSDINRFGRAFALGTSFEEFSKSLIREHIPGTFNHYVSINTQVLGMLLKKVTNTGLTEYCQEKLWNPLGMQDKGEWIIDNTGMEMALGGLNVTLRDYAKIGMLYLNDGKWNGKQIISKNWIQMSVTPDANHLKPGKRSNSKHVQGYGFQWWIPKKDEGDFFATGIYNQFIYVQPKKNTVIVVLSANYHYKNKKRGVEKEHIALFKEICNSL